MSKIKKNRSRTMLQYEMVKAERLSKAVEETMGDLIDKLCEGEPVELRGAVWAMLCKRMAARQSNGTCFRLPGLDDC